MNKFYLLCLFVGVVSWFYEAAKDISIFVSKNWRRFSIPDLRRWLSVTVIGMIALAGVLAYYLFLCFIPVFDHPMLFYIGNFIALGLLGNYLRQRESRPLELPVDRKEPIRWID